MHIAHCTLCVLSTKLSKKDTHLWAILLRLSINSCCHALIFQRVHLNKKQIAVKWYEIEIKRVENSSFCAISKSLLCWCTEMLCVWFLRILYNFNFDTCRELLSPSSNYTKQKSSPLPLKLLLPTLSLEAIVITLTCLIIQELFS